MSGRINHWLAKAIRLVKGKCGPTYRAKSCMAGVREAGKDCCCRRVTAVATRPKAVSASGMDEWPPGRRAVNCRLR